MPMPKKVLDRLQDGLKRLIPIIQQQKARDVSEADTVTLVKDLLSDAFGYDKYAELSSEHAIRGTYCDLAIKIDTRKELRKLVDINVDEEDIIKALKAEVLKRDTLEGPEAEAAVKRVSKATAKALKMSKAPAAAENATENETGLSASEIAGVMKPNIHTAP